jgi:hypothetical protein
MKRRSKFLLMFGVLILAIVQFAPVITAVAWLHMFVTLEAAKREGVYTTPEDGMRVLVEKSWIGVERVEIEYAGANAHDGSNPHVWFVTARVWAARRGDWKPVSRQGYDLAGSFFLRVQDGWVHVAEGHFPALVGSCMRLFGYWG